MGQKLRIPSLPKSCGKVRHYSEAIARRHLESLVESDRVNRPTAGGLKVYWCDGCGAHHVGHASGVSTT